MSEVRRYGMIATVGDYHGRPHAYIHEIADEQGDWVRFEDYERDTSSLRMELTGLDAIRQKDNAHLIQQRDSAIARCERLVGLLRQFSPYVAMSDHPNAVDLADAIEKELGHGG